jgi:hypothetical protein
LSQMTPAALAANRDELFFRAGEASGRSEQRESTWAHRVVWPVAAAALALLAAGLGTAHLMREPQVRVVHIERPARIGVGQSSGAATTRAPRDGGDRDNDSLKPAASVYTANEIRHRQSGGGIIHGQDWAALSDAFAGQLRLQQERSRRAREAMLSATVENDRERAFDAAPRQRAPSYFELRDAMQSL